MVSEREIRLIRQALRGSEREGKGSKGPRKGSKDDAGSIV